MSRSWASLILAEEEKVTEQDRQFTQTHYNKKNNSLHGKEYTAGEMRMGDIWGPDWKDIVLYLMKGIQVNKAERKLSFKPYNY